jgi:hypothetical protein
MPGHKGMIKHETLIIFGHAYLMSKRRHAKLNPTLFYNDGFVHLLRALSCTFSKTIHKSLESPLVPRIAIVVFIHGV